MRENRLISRPDWPPLEDQLTFRRLPDSLDRWLSGLRSTVCGWVPVRSMPLRVPQRETVAERLLWRRVATTLDPTRPVRPRRT